MRAGKKKLLIAVAALALLGLLIYRSRNMLHLGEFSGEKLWSAIRTANPYDILFALIMIYGCYALRALRWQVFQRNLGHASFTDIYSMTLAGFSAVFLLGRPGEPIRPLLLARRGRIPVADTFGIWVLERLFDFASMVGIAAIALLTFDASAHAGDAAEIVQKAARTAGVMLTVGLVGAIAAPVYLRLHGTSVLEGRLQRWIVSGGWRATLAKVLLGFIRGIQTIRSWRDLVEATFLSAVHWYFVVMIYLFVSHGFGGKLALMSVSDCMLLAAFTLVGSVAQLPAVGGGSQALAIFAYSKIFGVESEPAVAAALVLWLVTFAACTFVGVPLLIREGFSLGKLRELAEHEKKELDEVVMGGPSHGGREGESDH